MTNLSKIPQRFTAHVSKRTSLNAWDKVFFDNGTPDDLQDPYPRFGSICDFLNSGSTKTVLDIACGSGRHAIELAKKGYYVYASDISRVALSIAEKLAEENGVSDLVHLFLGDMFEKYNFPDASLDAVIAIQAIYHGYPKDMQKSLGEINRVLKKGGRFVFTLSRDHDRSMLGSATKESKEVDYKTYLPLVGRERGLPHYYPDEDDVTRMLNGCFSSVEMVNDDVNKYLVVYCIK